MVTELETRAGRLGDCELIVESSVRVCLHSYVRLYVRKCVYTFIRASIRS